MVTLLYGPNTYARDRALAALKADYLSVQPPDSVERYDGELLDVARLNEAVAGVALFASEKLVIIRGASGNKAVWEALGDLVETMPDTTELVLVEDAPDKRTRTFKQLQKHGHVQACDQLSESELIDWLQQTARDFGKTVTPAVARLLVGRVGVDQQLLSMELEKLLLAPGDIDEALVQATTIDTPEGNAFALLDATLSARPREVAANLALIRQDEDPYRFFALLVSQVFSLAVVWAGQKLPPAELATSSGLHPFVIKKLTATSRRLTRGKLDAIAAEVAALDDRLKSSSTEPWELIELSLLRIATDAQ